MQTLLLKLIGAPTNQPGRIIQWSIEPHGGIGFGWLIVLALLLVTAAFVSYHRAAGHLARFRRLAMASLRGLLIVLLLFILARPVFHATLEESVQQSLPILVDTTQSMGLADLRGDEADLKRAAIAKNVLDPAKGLDQPANPVQLGSLQHVPRIDLIKSVLKNPRMNLLSRLRKDYLLEPFKFGTKLAGMTAASDPAAAGKDQSKASGDKAPKPPVLADNLWIDQLSATDPETHLGDAVTDILAGTRGQPRAGMVICTDGQSNAGRSIVLAAEQAKNQGVPLYIYGVGISSPKDIIVSNMFCQDVAFVNDTLPVRVLVRNRGLAGTRVPIRLTLDDKEMATQDIVLDASGEQEVQMSFTPTDEGDADKLKARIEPLEVEASKDNNETSQSLKVVNKKIKVLYIEQSPRWEFKYLMAMLLRDRRVEFKTWLVEGSPKLSTSPESPYLPAFPESVEELGKYDLLIWGDVDPKKITPEQMESIERFVSVGGGGLLSIAGRNFNPWAYGGTKLAELQPVDVAEPNAVGVTANAGSMQPITLELTQAGREATMLRLAGTPDASAEQWAKLPPIYWDAQIYRAKPGAAVLAEDTDITKRNRFGRLPVIVLGQPGLGQSLFIGTDNSWRWRKNVGDKIYVQLWGQMVQRLSLPHLLGVSKKTQISSDQEKYLVGDKVTIRARLYDDALKPVDVPQLQGFCQEKTGPAMPFILRPEPQQKGFYRGELIAPSAGNFTYWVDRDAQQKRDFNVVLLQMELADTAMNEQGLRDMAVASGGEFFREEDLFKLPEVLRSKTESVRHTFEVEIWSSWLNFLLIIAVVTAEWIVRKLSMLK